MPKAFPTFVKKINKMFPDVPIEMLNKNGQNTLVGHLGIEITHIEKNAIYARMPVDHRTVQPMGLLHGGASVALAETIGSIASTLVVDLKTQFIVGTEIGASHVKSARKGFVTATCRPIHIGRTSHIWDIKVTNEEDQLVSMVRFTTRIMQKKS